MYIKKKKEKVLRFSRVFGEKKYVEQFGATRREEKKSSSLGRFSDRFSLFVETMATMNYNESINTEREKANLLCLIKLTLNTLIDQSSSTMSLPVLDDRNPDVTNFLLTLERILSFRMRGNWLSDRRFFWDFIRPACIGSCQQSIVERVEEVSKSRNSKEKGRAWMKFALMEKKLSELLKLVISDATLVRKFYHDDSIMISPHAFILCDQLAGLSAIDFSFCFKQDGLILAPILLNDSEIDVIDLTPFLSYRSKQLKSMMNDENKDPTNILAENNELKPLHLAERERISLEKYKLEIEQRKYFEELLQHRDREVQQMKIRYETLKGERESEIIQMENIILELQRELRAARDEIEMKRKKVPTVAESTSPPNFFSNSPKCESPTTPTNDLTRNAIDVDPLSRRSSHSTTTTNTDDDQYEMARQITSTIERKSNENSTSSLEIVSSASSSLSDEDEREQTTIITE